MQAVADRVDCAVGTIYTYFSSKSALLAALQSNAIRVLADSHEQAASSWDDGLEELQVDYQVAALVRTIALTRLFTAWPDLQPNEFDFLQMLITSRESAITAQDAMAVAPQALVVMSEGRVLIDAAVDVGAIRQDPERPGDDSLSRTVRWIAGLDGAVLVAAASKLVADLDPDAFGRRHMAERLTADLLLAWGASKSQIEMAFEVVTRLEAGGQLLPERIR